MKTAIQPFSFWRRLQEIDKFFEGRGREHKTMRRLVKNLDRAKIAYAVMGGMAVNAHRHKQTTQDVDVLLSREGFQKFLVRFVPRFYGQVTSHRFLDRRTVDIQIAGQFPGSGNPGPIAFPSPESVAEKVQAIQVVNLPALIQLKLAVGRHKDLGDVVHLIAVHGLDESFQAKLHPSVHRDFIECLEEKRREDAYELKQDQAVARTMEELARKRSYPKGKR